MNIPKIVHFTESESCYTVLLDDGRWFNAYYKSVPREDDPTKCTLGFVWDELPQPPAWLCLGDELPQPPEKS